MSGANYLRTYVHNHMLKPLEQSTPSFHHSKSCTQFKTKTAQKEPSSLGGGGGEKSGVRGRTRAMERERESEREEGGEMFAA